MNDRDTYGNNQYKPMLEEFFLRPLSRPIARLLSRSSITPDEISVIGFVFALISSYFIGYGYSALLCIVFLYITLLFDKIDGDLARITGIAGRKGQYIDGVLDALSEPLLIIALALRFAPISPVLLGLAASAPLFFNYHGLAAPFYLDIQPATHNKNRSPSLIPEILFYGRAKFFLLIAASLLLDESRIVFWVLPLLIIYTLMIYTRNIFVKKLTKR